MTFKFNPFTKKLDIVGAGSSPSPGDKVVISSQTMTDASSVTFTSLPTGYSYYYLEGLNVTDSVNNEFIYLRVSTNNGVSYEASSYSEYGYLAYSGGLGESSTDGTGWILINNSISTSLIPEYASNFYCNLYNLQDSSHNSFINLNCTQYVPGSSIGDLRSSGMWVLTTPVNGLQIICATGTLSGTFRLFGVV
jgi:hypothetical protein